MKLLNVWAELLLKPWAIVPELHQTLCDIAKAHTDGTAHNAGGIVEAMALPVDSGNDNGIVIESGVAIIKVHGVIGHRVGQLERSSGVADVSAIADQIMRAATMAGVRGIMLDVSSPGGTTTGTPEAAEVVRQVAASMPVMAYTDSLMASAAYWLVSGASMIMASKSANVGSIGVYMAWLDVTENYAMQGIKTELIKAGKFKASGIDGISLTDDQRAMLQGEVDKVYGWFTSAVNAGRGTVAGDVMQGQVYFGEDAVGVNLSDAVGSFDEAFGELKSLMGESI